MTNALSTRHAPDCEFVTSDNPWSPCTCGFGRPSIVEVSREEEVSDKLKLVPVEATREMKDAMLASFDKGESVGHMFEAAVNAAQSPAEDGVARFNYLCSLMPEGFHWSDPLTPDVLDHIVRAALQAAPAAEPGQWVHCSPALLNAGVSCANTPRRACACVPENGGHDHFIAHTAPQPAANAPGMAETPSGVGK